ncbi:MAG: hypothetical protein SWE60_03255 [Thermodesulfobacteriota bacterium]|nr:hypothetical protein [Thermodesulfobacteriota bacterium]
MGSLHKEACGKTTLNELPEKLPGEMIAVTDGVVKQIDQIVFLWVAADR